MFVNVHYFGPLLRMMQTVEPLGVDMGERHRHENVTKGILPFLSLRISWYPPFIVNFQPWRGVGRRNNCIMTFMRANIGHISIQHFKVGPGISIPSTNWYSTEAGGTI